MNFSQGEIQVSILHTIEGEEELRKLWNAMVLQMETPQVFLTFEWTLAVERAYKKTIQPRIFTFKKHGKLIGVAALACNSSDPRKLFFLGASTGDYCDVVSAPANREEIIDALLREFRKLQIEKVFLASIPEVSSTLRILTKSRGLGYWSFATAAYICRRILFDQTMANAIAKPIKTERLRRLAKLGEINIEHLRSKEQITPALDSVVKAQISRFLVTGRLSPLLKPERRRFLEELTSLLSLQQSIDLSVLKLNQQDIAWHFGFQFEGILSWYLPTFDGSLESHSPGACLLNLVSDENRNEPGLKEIDLGLGDEGYKDHFANAQRETFNIYLSASLAGHCKTSLRDTLSKTIKRFPRVEQFVRTFLSRKSGLEKSSRAALLQKISAKIYSSDQTIFFESTGNINQKKSACQVATLDWDNLGSLALQNSDDPQMLEYLRQTSPRIRLSKKKPVQGFVVHNTTAKDVQFFWSDEMSAPGAKHSQAKVLIFDHYTSASIRGKRLHKDAIESVAVAIKQQGKTPWMSVNCSDHDTLQVLDRTSFTPRYSIICRKFIFSMPVEKQFFDTQPRP